MACNTMSDNVEKSECTILFWIMHPSTYLNSALSKRDKFGSAFLKIFILLLQLNFAIPLHLIFFFQKSLIFLPFMMQIIFQLIPWKTIFFNVISTLCATKTQQPRASSSSYISRPRNFEKKKLTLIRKNSSPANLWKCDVKYGNASCCNYWP